MTRDEEIQATGSDMLRHFLAAFRYRADKVLHNIPESFPEYEVGGGVRKPVEILSHMSDVLVFLCAAVKEEDPPEDRGKVADWTTETARFENILVDLNEAFLSVEDMKRDTQERMLQGPLSDAMTHVGQLALIRRLAGAPLPPENFFAADIRTGSP